MVLPASLTPFDRVRHSADWRSWGELASEAPPFLAPEFFALIRPLGPRGTALVAQARSSSALAGVLPLVLEGNTLRGLRSDHSPGYDFCGNAEAIDAIWACLRDDTRWSELVFDSVPAASLLATRLPVLARADGRPSIVRPGTRHPYFALPGFEAQMSSKFRVNLQRCARKAGGIELERIAVPTTADLAAATAIEAMAWKGAAGTSIAADARVAHVYRALGRVLGRRHRSSLYFLRAGGERIATLFAAEDRHTLFALKIGFDPKFSNLSPGHLMIWEVARDAEKRGLAELDFVGHEDDWKKKWTDLTHEQVSITIYQRDARGLVRYGLREIIKPRLPEPVRSSPRSPLPRRCQRADIVGEHAVWTRAVGRIRAGLGIKRRVRGVFRNTPPAIQIGEPSAFPAGSWVRVKDRSQIEAILDERQKTRGLAFVPTQWETCGRLYRVQRQVRRIRDDHGRFRPVSRTVLLDGVDCSGHGAEPAGCGRHCPLMFRDDWLEAAPAPRSAPPLASTRRHARVRSVDEITAGLDLFGRRDGLTFMPEMAAYATRRYPIVRQLDKVFENDRWVAPRQPLYILDGLHCSGAIVGSNGPCDRACALIWHADWLVLEDA